MTLNFVSYSALAKALKMKRFQDVQSIPANVPIGKTSNFYTDFFTLNTRSSQVLRSEERIMLRSQRQRAARLR